jgi:alpha-amylase/alpha-mannosidase (GH57 family)
MGQITFSEAEHQNKTRREIFLERMGKLIPWSQMEYKVADYLAHLMTWWPRLHVQHIAPPLAHRPNRYLRM